MTDLDMEIKINTVSNLFIRRNKEMNKEEIISTIARTSNGTILSFPERGPWGSSKWRGNFSGWIPASLIYRYDAKSVSEIFAGGGTTSDLCKDLDIPYTGIDLNPRPVRKDIVSMDILDDSMELPDMFYTADLQMLHPPYPSINGIHYSNGMWKDTAGVTKSDIQEMPWDKAMNCINKALLRGYTAMPSGSYQAVVVGDVRNRVNGKSMFRSMFADLAIPGELVQVLVKQQHNTVSGRNGNTYGSKRNFFLIEHEFIVVIKKPTGYELMYVVPKQCKLDIRDSKMSTWKDVVFAVMRKLGTISNMKEIYAEIEGHKKCESNPHWKDKVRQVLQQLQGAGLLISTGRGCWSMAA